MNNTPNNFSSLICITWNCNSIRNKLGELKDFLNRHNNIDIVLLQEIRNANFSANFPGFRLYNTPRSDGSDNGGTAILIKNYIPHHIINSTPVADIDYTGIAIDFQNFKFNIFSIYAPPPPS